MSKEFIDNRLDTAHDLIDRGEFNNAVGILKNIKIRIHDAELEKKISDFESIHDKEVQDKLGKLNQIYADSLETVGNEQELAKRYAVSYLNFYDKLNKENEIY